MKRKKVIEGLEEALNKLGELIKASKGEKSLCGVEDFEGIEIYVSTWIITPINSALEELKRGV